MSRPRQLGKPDDHVDEEDQAADLTVVVERDALGTPIETVVAESLEAAQHWDDRLWGPA